MTISSSCLGILMSSRPFAAYILSLIAGVLMVLGSMARLILQGLLVRMMERMGMGALWGWWFGFSSWVGVAGLLVGGALIYAAVMLNSQPAQHTMWGGIILVLSLLGFFTSWAGFGLGLLVGLSGGALAIAWRPPN
jgi:hypothetical protein